MSDNNSIEFEMTNTTIQYLWLTFDMLIELFCRKSEAKRAIYAVPRNNCTYKLFEVGFDSLLLYDFLAKNIYLLG